MTREEAKKKACERYPGDFGPCDKPSIYDDARTLRIQREAYIEGLLDGSSEKPNNHKRNKLFDECVAKCDPATMKEVSDNVDKMLMDEDIITLHLGKILPDEQYNEVVRSVVAFMNQRWPNCKVGVDN